VVASVEAAMARIKSTQASGDAAGTSAQEAALKGDFSKSLSKSLAAKLDSLGSDPNHPLPAAQKAALCASYASIAAGSGQVSQLCGTTP
jgi:hypothetical protein